MSLLFIHDHKFPKFKGEYFCSYGFDDKFCDRYIQNFGKIKIMACHTKANINEAKFSDTISENITFITFNSIKDILKRKVRKQIEEEIKQSEYLIVRLPSFIGLMSLMYIKKLNKPYLVEMVGCPFDALWNHSIYGKILAPIMYMLCKKEIKEAPYVVYVTNEFLQKRYPTKGKSISCSNVMLPKNEKDILQNRLKKIQSEKLNKKIILGTCATVGSRYKGQQNVIKSIKVLREKGYEVEYQLVGGGDNSYLKNIAKKYDSYENIKFMGVLTHSEVFDWLDTIDIYVQPSLTEGLPRSLIEALNRGCPAIGSDAGGIPELLLDKSIYPKESYKEFVDAFEYVNMHKEELAIINFKKAKEYENNKLEARRSEFFKVFKEFADILN
ncbi:glycosyltransferase [Paraclostridium bifermentans]|uniref:glycosyltransferase n=1 Tax=Paraclostridium bifermentans TaxID=1490 RepID=UPI0025B06C07|nr:glycosyltransferase [Paraclostridium bifermentans]